MCCRAPRILLTGFRSRPMNPRPIPARRCPPTYLISTIRPRSISHIAFTVQYKRRNGAHLFRALHVAVALEKRWRATALQDAGANPISPHQRALSWTAPVIWRFSTLALTSRELEGGAPLRYLRALRLQCRFPSRLGSLYPSRFKIGWIYFYR
jgi:hypothetical protein